MAKNEKGVEVEALMRFPYKGRGYFIGDRLTVSQAEAAAMKDEKIVQDAKGKYLRRDMQAADKK